MDTLMAANKTPTYIMQKEKVNNPNEIGPMNEAFHADRCGW